MSLYAGERPEYLTECLESLAQQTLLPGEVIVVLDGPIDNELTDILSKYNNQLFINIVPIRRNVGLGLALNEGLKKTRFDFIARMDTDDICLPERFEKQISYLTKHPDVSVLGSNIAEFRKDPQNICSRRQVPIDHDSIVKYAKFRCPMNHMTVVFRKSSVLSTGGYRDLRVSQDYDLWVRMLLRGYKFSNIDEELVLARIGNLEKKRGGRKYLHIERQIFKSFYHSGFITATQFRINIALRFLARTAPSEIRKHLYHFILRRRITKN
ncbi:MAG: glycosyltransferase [Oligoflexus sp.]